MIIFLDSFAIERGRNSPSEMDGAESASDVRLRNDFFGFSFRFRVGSVFFSFLFFFFCSPPAPFVRLFRWIFF